MKKTVKKRSKKKVKRRKKVNFDTVSHKSKKYREEPLKKAKKQEPLKINMPLEHAIKILSTPQKSKHQ